VVEVQDDRIGLAAVFTRGVRQQFQDVAEVSAHTRPHPSQPLLVEPAT
jgi:hypothetical protein